MKDNRERCCNRGTAMEKIEENGVSKGARQRNAAEAK